MDALQASASQNHMLAKITDYDNNNGQLRTQHSSRAKLLD